jgi:hypothetical protein
VVRVLLWPGKLDDAVTVAPALFGDYFLMFPSSICCAGVVPEPLPPPHGGALHVLRAGRAPVPLRQASPPGRGRGRQRLRRRGLAAGEEQAALQAHSVFDVHVISHVLVTTAPFGHDVLKTHGNVKSEELI